MKQQKLLLTVLAVFAVSLSSCRQEPHRASFPNVSLPQVGCIGCEDYFGNCIRVSIDKTGSLSVCGRSLTDSELDAVIDGISNDVMSTHFMIGADTNAPVSRVYSALELWRKHGGYRVLFMVTDDSTMALGAVRCSLPEHSSLLMTNEESAITIALDSSTIIVNGEHTRIEDLRTTLASIVSARTNHSSVIIVRPSTDISFARLMEPLIVCKELRVTDGLCVMIGSRNAQPPSAGDVATRAAPDK